MNLMKMNTTENSVKTISVIPKRRQELLNWSGWGYKDSRFWIENNRVRMTGKRYPNGGQVLSEKANAFMKEKFDIDFKNIQSSEIPKMPLTFPEPKIDKKFMEKINDFNIDHSVDGADRLIRCHGQTLHDIHSVRTGKFNRIPDIVLWPINHDEVVKIVKLANQLNVVVIPFGGGTSVSGSVTCPQDETDRCISVLDTSQMNQMLWLDKENLVACFEAGIVGQDLERVLASEGLTLGHEPDSHEFSTLGGWVATRASGMKKNVYGNIEDLVVQVKMVTSKGVLERNIAAPRVSCGPDFNHIILGSEGTLGVITEVLIKVRPLPLVKKYGSLVFPDFESGVKCLREIAKQRCQPASIRLIDNDQFIFGQALSIENSFYSNLKQNVKKLALTKIKGYDWKKITIATLLFEGDKDDVQQQKKRIFRIAKHFSGFSGGESNGMKGYMLTFVIAYIRDCLFDLKVVGESFETSVPWNKCEQLCSNVKAVVTDECEKRGIKFFAISSRVTQTYDAGACVYFYFGFKHNSYEDALRVYEEIEKRARDEIFLSGGSISHHHGVGKVRAQWFKQSISSVGVSLYKSAKIELDPKNIFATGNFLMPEDIIDFTQISSKL